jgi:molybdopterin/thiamine biosynthesis adenylyltransferase
MPADLRDAVRAAATVRAMPGGITWRILMPDAVAAIAADQEVERRAVELAALDEEIVPVHYMRNIARYAIRGQMALLEGGVALVAAGAAAQKCLEILAVSGIGELRVLAPGSDAAGHAAELAALGRNLNASITVRSSTLELRRGNPAAALQGVSVVACCLENAMDETLLQAACRALKLPFVCAGVQDARVQATTVFPGDPGMALVYRPEHPHLDKDRPGASFGEGRAPAVAGAWLAEQSLALLLGDTPLHAQLRYADLDLGVMETYPLGRGG